MEEVALWMKMMRPGDERPRWWQPQRTSLPDLFLPIYYTNPPPHHRSFQNEKWPWKGANVALNPPFQGKKRVETPFLHLFFAIFLLKSIAFCHRKHCFLSTKAMLSIIESTAFYSSLYCKEIGTRWHSVDYGNSPFFSFFRPIFILSLFFQFLRGLNSEFIWQNFQLIANYRFPDSVL